MINIYRVNYLTEELANTAFVSLGVIDEEGNYINGTQAVVNMGYDTTGSKQFYEIMSTDEIDFGPMINLLGSTPDHKFYGWE